MRLLLHVSYIQPVPTNNIKQPKKIRKNFYPNVLCPRHMWPRERASTNLSALTKRSSHAVVATTIFSGPMIEITHT